MRSFGALIVAALLVAALPGTALADGELLAGEKIRYAPGAFNPSGETYPGTLSGSFDCGAGTFDAQVLGGNAYGPYPGTFDESVSVHFAAGSVTSIDLAFDIDAGTTTISGSASWSGGPSAVTCATIDQGDGDVENRVLIGSFATPLHFIYEAAIDGPGGVVMETGTLHGSIGFNCWNCFDLAIGGEGSISLIFDGPDPDNATGDPGANGTVATGFGDATLDDPTTTAVTTPTGGTVIISEGPAGPPPAGYALLGQAVSITAPPATADDPLRITFRLDASVIPSGEDASTIDVFRNGVLVPECEYTDDGFAVSLPCVDARFQLADGDAQIRVLTIEASVWNLGVAIAGAPDAEAIAAAVEALPDGAFKARGHRSATTAQLAGVQDSIDAGHPEQAANQLANLRGRVDGCGVKADRDDWIVGCASQLEIRTMLDGLMAYLGG